ncbi:ribose-5-phosphate isomerase RpiA [Jeotgalibaca sp. MA1X17-3]|uniref:ribose-5-phosphate isomerase RpiA n=1 Tax=Jeotgalibaca sp. MA1X17-3 TaxID=2908211 RepID=UPI001F27BF28|nr:ribose-5-phosphate isomerase RpiA [Jeotgalibaca sp. MA1X17-3]UJF16659.1 ribose-5-phosphate isomerase RpiA [Jeotgalibaca sp. MA1X17-3]
MNLKKMVGIKAAEYIKNDMIVGLGTGSTAYFFVEELGRLINEEGLRIIGVTTSDRTQEQALALGIPLKSVDEVAQIDLTVDGADEISNDFQGIKGGGAAHLYEKIVANHSKKVVWIVDQSKMVEQLGAFPLPLEVIKYGSQQVFRILEEKGYKPTFRKQADGTNYLTDENNYIIDLHLGVIENPHALAEELDRMTGIVEHGLFLNRVQTVLIGSEKGVEVRESTF